MMRETKGAHMIFAKVSKSSKKKKMEKNLVEQIVLQFGRR
jgi:hypothetical protein